ncbi:alpha/beta hydrolase family protein [Rhodococcoides yunnanense]|uniref:alpha/beta hydrolase family protein n=1 Tax=Rhodococcoides yunnanense TaxID=278209 RepID=UPI000A073500|nr:alpha/beta fold hydrolase [Rhodococcus yunnanensis]
MSTRQAVHPIIPVPDATAVVSVKPVGVGGPDRGLQVRVSAPMTGRDLPVIVFAHGFGSSLEGYGPLTDYWAAHGFVVVQPTFLDSRTVEMDPNDPRRTTIWRQRVADMIQILDGLDVVGDAVPGLAGRVDRDRIAVAGHSFGGQTAGNLLGLRVRDPSTGVEQDLSDPRVAAGILLATAGKGGSDLTPAAAEQLPFLDAHFEHMATPALVVVGDRDDSPLSVRGPEWMADPYELSPGDKSLLTLVDAEHSLGGIPGYDAKETTDDNPATVGLLQQVTWAYLRHALGLGSSNWHLAQKVLAAGSHPRARLEVRSAPTIRTRADSPEMSSSRTRF